MEIETSRRITCYPLYSKLLHLQPTTVHINISNSQNVTLPWKKTLILGFGFSTNHSTYN